MTPRTLTEVLDRAAAHPSKGLRFLDRREQERFFTWSEVRTRALSLADRLRGLGIRRGDRVMVVHPTSPEFVTSFLGAVAAGAVPVAVAPPPRLGPMEEYLRLLAALAATAGPRLLLGEPRLVRRLAEDPPFPLPPLGVTSAEDLPPSSAPPPGPPEPVAPEDLALLQFSSGTTAAPKLVALSHRALVEQMRALNELWPDDERTEHSGLSWLPLHHDMGLVGFLLSSLWAPVTLTLLQPEVFAARPALWLRAIGRYGATISAAPSFGYALAVEKVADQEMEGVDLSRWSIALNGAEAVDPATIEAFSRRFARWGFRSEAMTPVYGLAEATLAVTFSDWRAAPRVLTVGREALAEGLARAASPGESVVELVSVGRPLAGMAIEIRDPVSPSIVLSERRAGTVFVRSPSLMEGYFGQPEETRENLTDGWLDTGDRGFLDQGELFLAGRVKDLIIVRGRNVAPETIEQAAGRIAGVRPDGVAAVAVSSRETRDPGTLDHETVLVFVERDRETREAEDERIAADAATAALSAAGVLPGEIVVLASGVLPRTTSGKVRRQEALRRWRAGTLRRAG